MSIKIPTSSWRIIETVIIRYPERKQEYEKIREYLLENTPFNDGQPRSNYPSNRVENAIVQLNSPKILRMEQEIKAVEKAYDKLCEQGKKLIDTRYWSTGGQKTISYLNILNVDYSESTMKRIVRKFFEDVGRNIGEIV